MKKLIARLFASSALIALVFANVAVAHEYSHGGVDIEHPWSRPTPPGTPMGVGYLVIRNNSDKEISLVGASTPRAVRVSIHETRMKADVMSMRWLESGLTIPAGETVELKPSSYHLMLEKLAEPLKAGESIPLTLEFEGAERMQVELKVQFLDADMKEPETTHSEH
ncbi:MAG TPA: copper chaperone PCu(A)C [Marinobacter sp.]|uniref:Copper chaperone PCu(A)C n=1 Tax=Marinobacter antarcticus TaxID=564117 RepID=A0A831R3W9_9GAMM|nr:copper chaperone PCu(A)C [Marinobacter antarcticus]HDZ39342.1 copper chaperone PCu(A)C [Marinobacter sp.]HEA52388.1 copper chaperone PCu(A)C [Marinobacter antarcticus]